MAKKEKEEKQIVSSKDILEQHLQANKEDHFNFVERVNWQVSTGSVLLDVALGGGITPSLLRMCGENNEGKTPQTLELMRNFLINVPNSKGFWVLAEGRGLTKENTERCGLKFVYSSKEWEVGTVFVLESNTYELFINMVKDFVLKNEEGIKYCFVVDSIDGLMLKGDKVKEISESNRVAGAPSLSKKMLQSLSLGMFKYGHLMILISQVTAEIKMDEYSKAPNRGGNFSGGNSLLHGADWIFEYQKTYPGDYIMDSTEGKLNDGKSKALGKMARLILQKSAVEKSRKLKLEYPIKFGRRPSGIWLEHEIILELIRLGLVIKNSGWLSFENSFYKELKEQFAEAKEQINGLPKFRAYLEENPELTKVLFAKTLKYSQIVNET
jgi:RecA/RadA recombinase